GHRFLEVVVNPPPQTYRRDDGREVVVEQHERRRFSGNIRSAAAHRYTDVSGLQRGRVIDAVSGHRDDFTVRLQRFNELKLLLRQDSREYAHGTDTLPQVLWRHDGELVPRNARVRIFQADLPGDVTGCRWKIARNHNHAY